MAAETLPTDSKNDPYAAWRVPNFQCFAAGWFLMTLARQIETVAISVYIYHQTGKDPLALGWLGLVQAGPFLALAIPGGQVADRWRRQWVLASTLALTTAVSIGLTAACWHHVPNAWIYGLLLIGAMGQALGSPSRAALLPQLVPGETFSNAIAWNSTMFHMASMVGPALGGLVVATQFGVPVALGLVAVCRLLSLGTVAWLSPRPTDGPTEAVSWQSVVAGIRFVGSHKLILATITLDMFAVLLGGATYLLPIFAEDILHFGPSGVGFLRSAEAAGAIGMAVLLTHLPPIRHAGRTLLWAVAGFGAMTVVFGLSQWFWLSMAAMFLIGALDNVSVVVRHTLVQMLTPDSMRGRVSAVNGIFIVASNDLGGLESGLTASLFTPVRSVVGGGLGAILVVLAVMRIWPEILGIGSLRDVRPAEGLEAEEESP